MSEDKIHPDHYAYSKYHAIDVIEDLSSELDGFDGFCIGNVIKYVWRFKHKNGCEDLEKAKWYLEEVIKKYKVE